MKEWAATMDAPSNTADMCNSGAGLQVLVMRSARRCSTLCLGANSPSGVLVQLGVAAVSAGAMHTYLVCHPCLVCLVCHPCLVWCQCQLY